MPERKKHVYPSRTDLRKRQWDRAEESLCRLAEREEKRREQGMNPVCHQAGWDRSKQKAVRFT